MKRHTLGRIKKVMAGILPETHVQGTLDHPTKLSERLRHYHTPGISMAVINDFDVEWARGYGLADSNTCDKVTSDTCFLAGSISKLVTAAAVMRLVQDGVLDLDEDVNRYLKSWRIPTKAGWQPIVTIRQIMSHSAGLTVHGFPGYHISEMLPTVPQILNGEAPANSPKVEVNILPGLQFRYSGGGTTVLQLLMTDVLKKPFPVIMHELVLDPLKMRNSTFEQPLPRRWRSRVATAHPWKGVPIKGRFHTYPEMAAAGLWTTAGDLAIWGAAMLQTFNGKVTRLNLHRTTLDQMVQPQLLNQKNVKGEHAGLGLFCNDAIDGFPFWHHGVDEGFVAVFRAYKDTGKGAVVMMNSHEGWPLLDEVLRAIAMEYDWPDFLPKQAPPIQLTKLDDYAGQYATGEGMLIKLEASNGNLTLQYQQQELVPLVPTSDTTFVVKGTNTSIVFERKDHKRVVSLTLMQEGTTIEARSQRILK